MHANYKCRLPVSLISGGGGGNGGGGGQRWKFWLELSALCNCQVEQVVKE